MIRAGGAILTLLAFGLAVVAYTTPVYGQEPPVGNPSEPEDGLQQQIAQMLLGSGGAASGIEEDPQLWALISQLTPDKEVTIGGEGVGGLAELPRLIAGDTGGRFPALPVAAAFLFASFLIVLLLRRRLVPSA